MSLVVWIAWNLFHTHFFVYVDDNFRFEHVEALLFHAHLSHRLPLQQMCLLNLWDDIGLLYKDWKQEFDSTLHIIQFIVNPNPMPITIPDACLKLLSSISNFVNITNTDSCHMLCEFQALAGYVNWALNVYCTRSGN